MRCSANSTEKPRRGDRCRPLRKPSTTPSVTTSSPPSLETSKGSSRSSRERAGDDAGRFMQPSIVGEWGGGGNPAVIACAAPVIPSAARDLVREWLDHEGEGPSLRSG